MFNYFSLFFHFMRERKVYSRVAKVEVVSGVRFMRVGREIGAGKREVKLK